jgi:hypothetical protein
MQSQIYNALVEIIENDGMILKDNIVVFLKKMKLVNSTLNSQYFISNVQSLLFPYYSEKIDA